MRTLVVLVFFGCAARNANQPQPPPPEASTMDEVQMRACESCRHNLELCRGHEPAVTASPAACMNDFINCLNAQRLDTSRCQGLN